MMRWAYLLLAVLGAVVPYSRFVPWLFDNGLAIHAMVAELWSTRIGAFFGLDVAMSAVTLLIFMRREAAALKIPHLWLPVVTSLLIGVSCGLPLFLFLRERQLSGLR